LFRDYQRQATCGEIQFRRWPLRAVSFSCVHLHATVVLTLTSINVWFYVIPHNPGFQRTLDRQRTTVVELLFTKQYVLACVNLRIADIIYHPLQLVPRTRYVAHVDSCDEKTDARVVYRRCRANNPAGGRRRGSARCPGIDQASYRDCFRKRRPFQRSPECCLYGETEDGGKRPTP
jgi:hypothetical protein